MSIAAICICDKAIGFYCIGGEGCAHNSRVKIMEDSFKSDSKLHRIKTLLKKITKNVERNKEVPEDFDFTYGGNFDDAYQAGLESGESELAFKILDIINE